MFEESVSIPSIWASMNSWFTPTVLFVLVNATIVFIAFTSSLANPKQKKQEEEEEETQPKLRRSSSVLQRLRSINLYNFRSQESHPSNPDTHNDTQQIHQTQYVFGQNHQEISVETQTQYILGQNQQEESIETHTHQYLFGQNHQDQSLETVTQYHEKPIEKETQFVFQQVYEPQSINTETQIVHEEEGEEEGEEEDEIRSLEEVYSQLTDHPVSRTTSDTNPASGKIPVKLPAKMRKSASMKSPFGHFEEDVEVRRPATVKEGKVTDGDDEVDAKADDFINKFKQQLKLQRLDSFMRYKDMITRGSSK